MNPFDTWGALVKWLEHLTVDQEGGGLIPPLPFRRLGNFVHPTLFTPLCSPHFVHPTLPVSFRRCTKSCWSLLSGVYARGSKRSHAGKWKKPVMDSQTLEKDTLGAIPETDFAE